MPERHSVRVPAGEVHARLGEHLLIDGFRLVLDVERSHGSWLVDARDGTEYLDMYTFFASAPLGSNPPGVVDDAEFMAAARPGRRQQAGQPRHVLHPSRGVRRDLRPGAR